MIQFAWQDEVSARVPRKKNDLASGEFAGEEMVGWRTERGFDFNPFLAGQSFDLVKPAAADDPDAIIGHAARTVEYNPQFGEEFLDAIQGTVQGNRE